MIREFNVSMFNEFMFFSFVVQVIVLLVTFIPHIESLNPQFKGTFKVIFAVFTVYYLLGMVCMKTLQTVIDRHPLPFLYALFFSIYMESILLNWVCPEPMPYVMLIGFRVMFPVLCLDYRWRVNLCNNLVLTFAVFVLSPLHKPLSIFITDVVSSTIFTVMGMVIGSMTMNNQLRYLDTREVTRDKELDIEKAKNEAKTAFLANMSHEIRTPLNSILGLNEMIIRESRNPQILEYANNIQSSGKTLLKIINDVLDFSKIEAGKLEIMNAEYDLTQVISELVSTTHASAKEKNVEFVLDVDQTVPHLLYGDELRVKQCIMNILNNAVKYTEKGSVTLSITYDRVDNQNIMLKVRVVDTGIGIKEEDLSHLFKAFERIDEKRNRTIEGTGLGMNIVQMLLQQMGSQLEVKSEYGKGSDFSFEIKQTVVWWEQMGDFNARHRRYIERMEQYKESFHAPNAHILIVDDTKMNLVVMKELLKRSQIQIDTALSGREMLELVQRFKYDVIFIDYRMPNMDGIEAFHAMERLENNKNIGVPCIALTANVISGARERYIREGFSDYLSKPVDSRQLEKQLRYYLPERLVTLTQDQTDGSDLAADGAEVDGDFGSASGAGCGTPSVDLSSPAGTAAESGANAAACESDIELEDIDMNVALQNCGTTEVFKLALKEYYDTIEVRAADIEKFAAQKDFRNYTVLVHALKSSSRLIGAVELGNQAAYLEKCGDEQNLAEIELKTPGLLSLYRSYLVKLAPAFPAGEAVKKSELPLERYNEAMVAVKEYAASFDFNAIDSIMEMLDSYEIPKSQLKKFAEIKRCVRAGDSAALLELL